MDDHPDVTPTTEAPGGLTITQAAALLSCHPNTIRKRIKDGTLPSQRVLTPNGLVYVIPRSALPGSGEPPAPPNTGLTPTTDLVPAEQVNRVAAEMVASLVEAMAGKDATIMRQAEELGRDRGHIERLEAELDRMRRLPWWRRILGP